MIFKSDPLTRSTAVRALDHLVTRGEEATQQEEWTWLATVESRLDELGRSQLWKEVLRRNMSDAQLEARYKDEGEAGHRYLAEWVSREREHGPAGTALLDALETVEVSERTTPAEIVCAHLPAPRSHI